MEEAKAKLRERSESERGRFIVRYGVDKARLRNYDLICDTTRASASRSSSTSSTRTRAGWPRTAARRPAAAAARPGPGLPDRGHRRPARPGGLGVRRRARRRRRRGPGAAADRLHRRVLLRRRRAPPPQRRPPERLPPGAGRARRRGGRTGGRRDERGGLLRRPGPARPDPRLGGRPRSSCRCPSTPCSAGRGRPWPGSRDQPPQPAPVLEPSEPPCAAMRRLFPA